MRWNRERACWSVLVVVMVLGTALPAMSVPVRADATNGIAAGTVLFCPGYGAPKKPSHFYVMLGTDGTITTINGDVWRFEIDWTKPGWDAPDIVTVKSTRWTHITAESFGK